MTALVSLLARLMLRSCDVATRGGKDSVPAAPYLQYFLLGESYVPIPRNNGNAARKPVLLVLHQEHSTPGRVGTALTQLGVPLDIRRPRFGDPLPDSLERHAGAVVFGGPMSANDQDEYIRSEIDWMAVPLAEQKPLLGICLGGQMLARKLGARVYCPADQHAEVGYYPLRATAAADGLAAPWPDNVYEWHREGFDLPPGAVLLAEGDAPFPVQAFRYGPSAFGIQFHPEVTYAMMCRWLMRGQARLALPGARPRAEHFADRAAYDFGVRTWLAAFLSHWLACGGTAATARPGNAQTLREVSAGMTSREPLAAAL
jgi:GMP synthase (glutamine-hydrolysing)